MFAALSCAGPAEAGCAPGGAGPRDFVCTGTISNYGTSTDARTIALIGASVAGYMAMKPGTGGNISFSTDANSSINQPNMDALWGVNGLSLITFDGAIDTNTPSGSGINGAITSKYGVALYAGASGTGANINVTTGAGGVLTGNLGGLNATTDGDNTIVLNLGGKVSASDGAGVSASTVDGAITARLDGDVTASDDAVKAHTSGNGAISISGFGNMASSAGAGVSAQSAGAGAISIDMKGNVSGVRGVVARSEGGDVAVGVAGQTTGESTGIMAATNGAGKASVTTGGKVTASSGNGVVTDAVDGASEINIGSGGVQASQTGVLAGASGLGSVKAQVHGDVSGLSGFGVAASTVSGSVQIDLDAGKFISGGQAGVSAGTQTGDIKINNAGTIAGLGAGAGVTVDANAGSATIDNSGAIKAGSGGIAVSVVSGAALVRNSGAVEGAIVGNGLTTVNNAGSWTKAAGSQIDYLNNAGVISMGPANGPVGVLAVTGDAAFEAGSIYNARLTPTGSDAIVVGGAATIKGGAVNLSMSEGASYQRGARYTLLSAAGGVNGQFDGVYAGMSRYTGLLSADANDIYLTALLRDFRGFALTRNQLSVADGVFAGTSQLSGGPGGQLLLALNQTADAALPGALTQLSGDGVVTGAANAAMQTGHLFTSILDDQQALWRDSQTRGEVVRPIAPFQYAPVRVEGSKWPVSRQHYKPAPVKRDDGAQRWRVWASGFGGSASLQGDAIAGSASQKFNSYGGALGVDYQLGTNMLMGLALGGSSSTFNAGDVRGSASGVHVGAYTGFRVAGFHATASVAYSNFSNKTTRALGPIGMLPGETERGSFTSEDVRTRLEVGRRVAFENFAVTPFAAVEIAQLHTKPFIEQAAGGIGLFALSFGGQRIASTPSFVGLKAQANLDLGGAIVSPWMSLAWRHEWSASRTQTATLSMLPGASFAVLGARPARDAAQVKGGVNVAITQTLALYAMFEGEFGAGNPVYSGRGGMRMTW
ncbi:MAG: autotransporter domain-containing protein [Rhodoblastus sp.]